MEKLIIALKKQIDINKNCFSPSYINIQINKKYNLASHYLARNCAENEIKKLQEFIKENKKDIDDFVFIKVLMWGDKLLYKKF